MNEVVRLEIIRMPTVYIMGKEIRYSDEALNSGDNRLPEFWDKCCKEGIFAPLTSQLDCIYDSSPVGVFLDWYLGDGNFSYIVGMLMKENAVLPDGYVVRRLEETDAALCWVKCQSITDTRTVPFESTAKAISEAGRSCGNMKWCIDLYNSERSVTPDENGYVILDCYIPLD